MASGLPVITVRKTCLPEVAGDAAVYADLTPESLAQAMREIEENKALRQKLIASGKKRLELYLPEKFAGKMTSLYQEAAEL